MIDRAPSGSAGLFDHGEEDFLPDPDPAAADLGPADPPPVPVDAPADTPAPSPPAQHLPADYLAIVAALWASPSIGAFLNKRVDQALRHGHTPRSDMELAPYFLARRTRECLDAALERLSGRTPAPRARLEAALKSVEAAGAKTMALHDRLRAEIERTPADD